MVQIALESTADICLIVDSQITTPSENETTKSDYIYASHPNNKSAFNQKVLLEKIEFTSASKEHQGEWIGMMKLSKKGTQLFSQYIEEKKQQFLLNPLDIRDALNDLCQKNVAIEVHYISGGWVDVDHVVDLPKVTSI